MARKKGPQVDQAYEYIKKKILSFDLIPGTSVSDNAFSQELEMSRSPIREAILRLTADGLIEMKNKHTQVTPMTLEDIVEICQVREAVEVAAINIIMDNHGMSENQKEQLTQVYHRLQDATELVENYFYDDQFHGIIMSSANNKRLIDISNRMRLQIVRARWLNFVLPDRQLDAAKEHEAIYEAIMHDDRKASAASLRKHLRNSEDNFKKVLNSPQYNPQFTIAMASISSSIHKEKETHDY